MKGSSHPDGEVPVTHDAFPGIFYEPWTGLFWRIRKNKPPKVAGTNVHGYVRLMVGGKVYAAHRLAWLMVYGKWPDDQIDHINLVRNDNRICNLRESSQSENQWNTRLRADNTSGVKDVCWHKRVGMWFVQIGKGEKRYRKYFRDLSDASEWARLKREELHGHYVRHQ